MRTRTTSGSASPSSTPNKSPLPIPNHCCGGTRSRSRSRFRPRPRPRLGGAYLLYIDLCELMRFPGTQRRHRVRVRYGTRRGRGGGSVRADWVTTPAGSATSCVALAHQFLSTTSGLQPQPSMLRLRFSPLTNISAASLACPASSPRCERSSLRARRGGAGGRCARLDHAGCSRRARRGAGQGTNSTR